MAARTKSSTLDPAEIAPNPATLSFTVADAPAATALAASIEDVRTGAWTPDHDLGWTCCVTGRVVEVDITSADSDLWAWVDLVGRFDVSPALTLALVEIAFDHRRSA